MKQLKKRQSKPLTIPHLFGRQVVAVMQIAGQPAKKRGGFSLEINFTMQSTFLKSDNCENSEGKP